MPVSESGVASGEGGVRTEGRLLQESLDWEVDAVFVATGFETFPAEEKPLLQYGKLDAVTTTADLDRVILEDRIDSLPTAGIPEPRVAFLQCIGSRDREAGRDYCSQVCCKTSLRLAARLLHERPAWAITIFYIDLQVFGKGSGNSTGPWKAGSVSFKAFRARCSLKRITRHHLYSRNLPQGQLKTETFDLVILAVGMLPPKDAAELSGLLQVPLERRGFFEKATGANGSRFYTVGACRAPTDIPGARRQAMEAVAQYLAKSGV